jgi:hypothetical protein
MPDTIRVTSPASLPNATPLPVRRVLVVANQTVTSWPLINELCAQAKRGPVQFHLVVPALNSHLRHWLSDTDDAVLAARRCGQDALDRLKSHGLPITMEVGDSVPLLAIDDALAQFPADEIVISTLPPSRSHWLEHDLVELARSRFDVSVRHVIVGEDVALAA